MEQAITSGRIYRGFVEAGFDGDRCEYSVGGDRRVANGLRLFGIDDGISQVAIDFAEVLFTAAGQHLFAAGKSKYKQQPQIKPADNQHRDYSNSSATELSHGE